MKSLILVILDQSESMETKMYEVLEGFNRFVGDQRKITSDSARFYLVKFSHTVTIAHKGIPLEEVPQLTLLNYCPNGSTALYDAIGTGIELVDKEKTADERVICVIMTDGEENSSQMTTLAQVKELITGREALGNWTFLYIGENPIELTHKIGIRAEHGIAYNHKTPLETIGRVNFAVTNFRTSSDESGEALFSEEMHSHNSYNDYSSK